MNSCLTNCWGMQHEHQKMGLEHGIWVGHVLLVPPASCVTLGKFLQSLYASLSSHVPWHDNDSYLPD